MTAADPTTLDQIAQTIATELRELNNRIMLALNGENPMMNGIIDEYLKRKGKQIRPIIVILASRLFQPTATPKTINAAASVEMLHNASLIHDDVVDESQIRRNQPTLNGIWDNHIAVLVGDYFTSTSLQLASLTGDIRIINTLAELGRRLATGELNQIYNARYHRLNEQTYIDTIDNKTASLFLACAQMGAYAANIDSTDPRLPLLETFARNLGLCFQITDDIFDYYPNQQQIGKPTGNDLREGKITLPLLAVLLRPDAPDRDKMLALITKDNLTTDQIQTLTSYAIQNGGIDYARAKMQTLADQATQALTQAFPQPTPPRQALINLLNHILHRTK